MSTNSDESLSKRLINYVKEIYQSYKNIKILYWSLLAIGMTAVHTLTFVN
jgi:hypothetical protein